MWTDESKDRFGDLPDSAVFDILSYLKTKEAVQTCILSKRWNNLTNNLPIITLDCDQFKSLDSFERALSQILSVRNEFDDVLDTLDLALTEFDSYDDFPQSTDEVFKRMVRYALSHSVRRLRYPITSHINPFPPVFSSQTLTSLDLSVPGRFLQPTVVILFPTHLNLPSLTNLTLTSFGFGPDDDGCADPFAAFNKLNTLTIIYCGVVNSPFRGGIYRGVDYNRSLKLRISPPSLCTFAFTGNISLELCLTHPCSLKHLHIDAEGFDDSSLVQDYSALLLTWLQGFPNITSLTLSSNTLQLLSLVPGLFKVKLTSLYNLESLQVQMKPLSSQLYTILCCGEFMIPGVELYQATIVPDGVVDCLIQNSPSANVTFIPYNKIQDPREVKMKDPRRRRRRRGRKAKQI
ncbi:putative F-box/FBD/LRR-repeat protein At4g03220 [Vicia villosa]|uniref:putative F-box/FBD/LRR-repeat protein At4g03220 n=1 Tax=Vicia villosa TaxID=3911 RepID=UPI00273B98ED|nr:putative F-box/FBD/LRR-repeat protein At4g03220 [Vicia villosa]